MNKEVTVILQGKDAQMWATMKALEALGVFDIKFGKVSIDFDGQSKISNIKVEKNYRVLDLNTLSTG